MFDKLRRPGRSPREGGVKKIFSYFVFGAICLVFVFLMPMGSNLMGEGVVGYVGSEPIRAKEFLTVEENIRRQYQSQLATADEKTHQKIQKEIRWKALQYLVELSLLVQSSEKAGFFLSDKELRSQIHSIPSFQENGKFSYSKYLQLLKANNMNPARFENRIRKQQLAENWQAVFRKAISSNTLEQEKKSQRYRYKVQLKYALVNAGEIEEENLEPLVQARDLRKINRFLKKNNVDWEETGVFSLVSAFGVSIAQNQDLMENVIHHLPDAGIVPKLIRQANKIYIVRIMSFEEGDISLQEQQMENFLSRSFDKSERVLNSWINFQKEKIKIKTELPEQI